MIQHLIKNAFDSVFACLPQRARTRLLRRWLEQACYPSRQSFTEIMDAGWALENLRRSGFSPRLIVDCGAHVGEWTRKGLKIFPDARFLTIEANSANESSLRDLAASDPGRITHAQALLGPEPRASVPFFEMGTGSSVMPEQSNITRAVANLPMLTLDQVLEGSGFAGAQFIKLDVQGYELEVLKGAGATLRSAEALILEVSFLEYNRGAPLAHEVLSALFQHGFVIFDLGAFSRWGSQNALLQADFIFVRKDSSLRPTRFEF